MTCTEENGPFDYVLNLSALKHVRSEKDPYTLMRMLNVNVVNIVKTIQHALRQGAKVFAVSTDKAANPVNLMGASKRIMENASNESRLDDVNGEICKCRFLRWQPAARI